MDLKYTIFLMSIIGSAGFIIFKAFSIVTKTHFSSNWHYSMLKWIAALFILPLASLSRFIQIPMLSVPRSSALLTVANQGGGIDNGRAIIDNLGATIHQVASKDVGKYVIYAWLIGTALFAVWQVICFVKFRRSIHKHRVVTKSHLLCVLEQCKKALNIKCTINLVYTGKASSPMLVGLFSPTIVLPNERLTEADAEYIFMHELTHYKSKDLWIKIICTAIKAVHWFNPITHLLCNEMEIWREFSCDEKVAKNFSSEQRKRYGMAILNSMISPSPAAVPMTPFASTKPNIERRLTIMLNFKKMKPSKKILSMAVAVAILACSAVPVLAAAPNPESAKIIWSNSTQKSVDNGSNAVATTSFSMSNAVNNESVQQSVLTEAQIDAYVASIKKGKIQPLSDKNLPHSPAAKTNDLTASEVVRSATRSDGTIVEYSGTISDAYANCDHNYQSGTFAEHLKYSDNSCTTNYYNALICENCNTIWVLEFDHSVTNRVCNH